MSSEHLHLGQGKESYKNHDTIARNVRVWVNVRVLVRTLTTVILFLEPSSSHLSRYLRPFWPTAIQGASSVSHNRLRRQVVFITNVHDSHATRGHCACSHPIPLTLPFFQEKAMLLGWDVNMPNFVAWRGKQRNAKQDKTRKKKTR